MRPGDDCGRVLCRCHRLAAAFPPSGTGRPRWNGAVQRFCFAGFRSRTHGPPPFSAM